MTTILCATRGGEASIPTQMKAIELAKVRAADLLFIYVANVDFLEAIPKTIAFDVQNEMEYMGEFWLQKAQQLAEENGVSANTVVKLGQFRAALLEAAQEGGATIIVLGSPGERAHTKQEYLEELAAGITEETGIETIIV